MFVIVCILFVFGALVAYAIILQKKKKHMWKVGVLPSESTFNIYNIFQLPSLAASAFESVSRRASMTFWPNSNRNSVVSVSPSPTSAPTLPPPPPPLPSAVEDPRPESSNGLPGSVGTISGKLNLVVPKPPALPPKPTPGSIWHDKDMDFVDKVFIVVFPLSFLLFNCVFWPILINYDEIF